MARIPAAIRNKNPGAMWPGAVATKWGSTHFESLNDGTDQKNKIATFDNWVDGICAQFDLWRSSPKYKNKRFADAIHIWDGGNNTPAYIKYVKDRIPGMDENTIMNDAFWRSSNGIKFLKTQAGHEGGNAAIAALAQIPEADWVEAQRRVMSGYVRVKTAAKNVQIPTADVDEELKKYQQALIDFGYYEVGEADGRIGMKTNGALKMFSGDRGLTFVLTYPSTQLNSEIAQARAERWARPIAPDRAYATQEQVFNKVASVAPTQKASLWQTITGYISAGGAVAGGAVKLLPDANDQASPYLSILQQWMPSVPTLVILGIVAAIAIATAIQLRKANAATQADYQKGKIN